MGEGGGGGWGGGSELNCIRRPTSKKATEFKTFRGNTKGCPGKILQKCC